MIKPHKEFYRSFSAPSHKPQNIQRTPNVPSSQNNSKITNQRMPRSKYHTKKKQEEVRALG